MRIDAGRVFGASERIQPVTEAPASVSFITAEEIARYGYRTLADILRGVRGLYVTNDRNFSLLGARGFGKPGDYNSRILLLVNGHRVNDNVFGQAEIGAEFGLDPAMFERVEIIRGPASSLYGDSAFFAVVNVITKSGASLDGGSLALEAGHARDAARRAAASASALANGVDIALSAHLSRAATASSGCISRRSTAPATNNGVAEGLDGERDRSVLQPGDLQELHVHRRLRPPPARRADGVVRHGVQRAGIRRSRPSTVTPWSMLEYAKAIGRRAGSASAARSTASPTTAPIRSPRATADGGADRRATASLGTRWTHRRPRHAAVAAAARC